MIERHKDSGERIQVKEVDTYVQTCRRADVRGCGTCKLITRAYPQHDQRTDMTGLCHDNKFSEILSLTV